MEPKDAMPWVGLYILAASFICALAMVVDLYHGFRRGELWFPCKFFTINTVSVTMIGIAMKLSVDLSAITTEDIIVRNCSVLFLVTMLANFLPSLGLMGDKELLFNIVALGTLLITILFNVWIQAFSWEMNRFAGILILPCLLMVLSVALTVPASRRKLEAQYKELRRLASNHEKMNFSYEELVDYVKMYWMMAETGNPQFMIACSQISFSFGLLCYHIAAFTIVSIFVFPSYSHDKESSDYKWSMLSINMVQLYGIVVGCLAPMCRSFIFVTSFKPSMEWTKNHLNVFKVEKEWTERLQRWKHIHVRSHIPGRHSKKFFHIVKNMILTICIVLQMVVIVICKVMCFFPRCYLIFFSYVWYFLEPLLKGFTWGFKASEEDVKKYSKYVLLPQEQGKLSERILTNTLTSITELIRVSVEKEPRNLMNLLDKSTGFNGVVDFDDDKVPPLYPEETQHCWSLVVVTLTTIAIALPNISRNHVKELLAGIREGLQIVRNIEETLNDVNSVHARKSARRLWTEVEVFGKWLEIDLQKKFREGKPSKNILQWLGDEAVKNVIVFKSCKKDSLNRWDHKFIASSSMYRISQTILLHFEKLENWPNDGELFERISTIIADLLCACFTNLPSVIKMKCHHDAIEKRGDNIRIAAQLLGKSKKIFKILENRFKERQLPNLDMDSMANINKWKDLPPNHCTSSTRVQLGASSSNGSFIVTIV